MPKCSTNDYLNLTKWTLLLAVVGLAVNSLLTILFDYGSYWLFDASSPYTFELGPKKLLMMATPLGVIGLTYLALLYEAPRVAAPSITKILHTKSNTLKQDIFYFFLRITGLNIAIGSLLCLGIPHFLSIKIHEEYSFGLLKGINPLVSFLVVWLVNSLFFYIVHRIMHTKWFWHLHKIHHSSTDMNIINGFRNHPIDYAISKVIFALPAAALGADPWVIAAYLATDGFYECIAHSEIKWKNKFWSNLLVSPQGHKYHHGSSRKNYSKMYGTLAIWDKIFGTWQPDVEEVNIGINDSKFNTGAPLAEMKNSTAVWLKVLKFQTRSFFRLNKKQ